MHHAKSFEAKTAAACSSRSSAISQKESKYSFLLSFILASGMCIEGTIAARDESTAFPLGPEIQARLTVSVKLCERPKISKSTQPTIRILFLGDHQHSSGELFGPRPPCGSVGHCEVQSSPCLNPASGDSPSPSSRHLIT